MASKEDEKFLENMVRVAKEGIIIGVNFNDSELIRLKEIFLKAIIERSSCRSHKKYADHSDLWNYTDYLRKLEETIEKDFFEFLKQKKSFGHTSSPKDSKYDMLLCLESTKLGIEYLYRVQKNFPNYRFVMPEALLEDPKENFFGHNPVVII